MVRGVRSQSGQRLPALRSYMDDVTSLLQTAVCTARLLKRFEELLGWARMRIKPTKSRSLSIRKGVRNDIISFTVDGERIPLLAEQPVRSLGRLYTADLSDSHMPVTVMEQLADGLERIDKSHLPGKLKVWCYQFTLYQRLMWPLKMCEITTSTVLRMDAKESEPFQHRPVWEKDTPSINRDYRQEKARLVLELRDSTDPFVRNTKAPVRTGRKWKAEEAVDQAISRLMHREIVGRTQSGRAGLGWGTAPKFWSKATRKERKDLVIVEVVRSEEEQYKVRALSQRQQGRWTTWEGVVDRTIKWSDMWKMPQARLSFLIRATYDTLPSPSNLSRWYGSEENCQLCNAPNPSLQHILSSCKTALAQGWYRWRHNQVLWKLAEVLEARRLEAAKDHSSTARKLINFVGQGAGAQNITQRERRSLLTPGCDWNLRVDLDRQLKFPPEITTTSLRPDIILWSPSVKAVILAELTVPWE
ncbi:hypothetical protein N1851_003944 [Merluccius polli]|uniref:Reverse transcriptase n=1 Tax=Merluccius polli TaxID=89951 RepID=A0AA47N9G6_MERPO|nr:hypothetical protein N1851_003944 [Merluccius polli]